MHSAWQNLCTNLLTTSERLGHEQDGAVWCYTIGGLHARVATWCDVLWCWQVGVHQPDPLVARWWCRQVGCHLKVVGIEGCIQIATALVGGVMQTPGQEA